MKLLMAIVHRDDVNKVMDALMAGEFRVTRINTAGGFLRRGNATLLIGVEDEKVDAVLETMRVTCCGHVEQLDGPPNSSPAARQTVTVGRAVIFVLDVEEYERL